MQGECFGAAHWHVRFPFSQVLLVTAILFSLFVEWIGWWEASACLLCPLRKRWHPRGLQVHTVPFQEQQVIIQFSLMHTVYLVTLMQPHISPYSCINWCIEFLKVKAFSCSEIKIQSKIHSLLRYKKTYPLSCVFCVKKTWAILVHWDAMLL